ncbi:MAG: transposase [Deltaproteobacteria bacterium]|jgi:hypothetical protein|nr:transposase [Deltaproteobacteria bacterium]
MALQFADIIKDDPRFDPYLSYTSIRKVERVSGTFALLLGKRNNTGTRDDVWLGQLVDERKNLFFLPSLGVFEFTMADGYTHRPDYAFGLHRPESYLLQYGNYWVYNDFLRRTGFSNVINNVIPESADTLNALLLYKLTEPHTTNYKGLHWFTNSYSKLVFNQAAMSSSSISQFLKEIGREECYRNFFRVYFEFLSTNEYTSSLMEFPILIDSTGLPNDTKMNITEPNCHNGVMSNEVRVIYVTDKDSGLPIFFKYVPGNIIDVSTLQYVIETLKMFHIDIKSVTMDAGYNSQDNINYLYSQNITFITRMQENRTEYKNIIDQYSTELLKPKYLVPYMDKSVFCMQIVLNIDGNVLYTYFCCDGDRLTSELNTYRKKYLNDPDNYDINGIKYSSIARFVLISNYNFDTKDILENYYKRQQIEQNFDTSKNIAALSPVRVHSEIAFRGHLLVSFIQTIISILLSKQLKNKKIDSKTIFDIMKYVNVDIYNNKEEIIRPLKKVEKYVVKELELELNLEIKSSDFVGSYLKKISKSRGKGRPEGRKNRKKILFNLDPNKDNNLSDKESFSDDEYIYDQDNSSDVQPKPKVSTKKGRPKGSKNKFKQHFEELNTSLTQTERRRPGRPKGSVNKPKPEAQNTELSSERRRPGRPKGSVNKPKPEA